MFLNGLMLRYTSARMKSTVIENKRTTIRKVIGSLFLLHSFERPGVNEFGLSLRLLVRKAHNWSMSRQRKAVHPITVHGIFGLLWTSFIRGGRQEDHQTARQKSRENSRMKIIIIVHFIGTKVATVLQRSRCRLFPFCSLAVMRRVQEHSIPYRSKLVV